LDELDITDNTLVVFASDHGEMLGAHCLRGKNKFFEESTRVPLFLKLPGVIPAGSIVDEPVSLIDVFSTILDYAGLRPPTRAMAHPSVVSLKEQATTICSTRRQ
jgi:arylsulfatase A-like enzyme